MGGERWHEARLLWASRRALFALLLLTRWAGPVRRVPQLGWLVAT